MQRLPNRVHYIQGDTLWGSRGPAIMASDDCGRTWSTQAVLPCTFTDAALARFGLFRRLLRMGIHHILPLSRRLVVFANKAIYSYQRQERRWHTGHTTITGSRPLCVCVTPQETIYYGEYRSNTQRHPVTIFTSKDGGVTWQPIYFFNQVRHIHGVFYDPYEDCLWATTGDDDHESGIWKSTDGFMSLALVYGGSQQARAVQLVFTNDSVYFGSDTPAQQNYLYRLERNSGKVTPLQKVGGSIFWGCRVGECLFFSTAVEPSNTNVSKHSELWSSHDGRDWALLAQYKKDLLPLRFFQYGQIFFPQGHNSMGRLWYSPFSTYRSGKLHSLTIKDCEVKFHSKTAHIDATT